MKYCSTLQPQCTTHVFDSDTIASVMISKHIMLTESHGQLTPASQQIQNCSLTGVPHYSGPYKIHRHFCLGLVVILFAIVVEAACREPQVSQRTHLNQVAPSKRYGLVAV